MKNVIIAGAARTPVGAFLGGLASQSAVQLGEMAALAALQRAGLKASQVDEAIMGCVLQAGIGQNPARQIAMGIGVPKEVTAYSVNMVCGSGLKAIALARDSILLKRAAIVLAGGTESMSQAPHLIQQGRQGNKLGSIEAIDSILHDALTDIFGQMHMGTTAENIAEHYQISREDQDRFALESQQKCAMAMNKNLFQNEIAEVAIKSRKGETIIHRDEHPRPDTSFEALSGLRPAFKKDGTVTAGNASGINDGAACVVVADEDSDVGRKIDKAQAVRLIDCAVAGCAPETMGLGPIYAVRNLLEMTNIAAKDIDLWELNEAFAAQSIAVVRDLNLDTTKVNVNGGAIALGHPVGASGARIVVTLIHEMKRRNARYGIAALCIGGGMGIAILLENI